MSNIILAYSTLFDILRHMAKYRTPRRRIAAAVSIDEQLYKWALEKRVNPEDTNFSQYVRELIRADLANPRLLESSIAAR